MRVPLGGCEPLKRPVVRPLERATKAGTDLVAHRSGYPPLYHMGVRGSDGGPSERAFVLGVFGVFGLARLPSSQGGDLPALGLDDGPLGGESQLDVAVGRGLERGTGFAP